MTAPDVVVGAGHNGLIAACYLARAGRDVLVLEQLNRPGGGSRTEETVPGYRFDLHSVAHNIINMTAIPAELDLAGVGLEYREMDPFSIAVFADGRIVRFHRSIDETLRSIAEHDQSEATAYREFLDKAIPIVRTVLPAIRGEMSLREVPERLANLVRTVRRRPTTARDLVSPYESLLQRWLPSDLTRGPVSAFAAHAGVGPTLPDGSLFAFWQAAYHLFGQWHAVGGAQGLTDALVRRLESLGGVVRCSAPVARIERAGGRVRGVVLEDGERIAARTVDRLETLSSAWVQSEAQRLPDDLPLYAFTTSALDDTLAPHGHHTVYLACPAAPSTVEGGWPARTDEFVERALDIVESRAPGFRSSIKGVSTFTPDRMAEVERWPGGHPMYLDLALDQLGPLRPTRALGNHRTPVTGLYVSGAGTNPAGGIAGTPGRSAARKVLKDDT